MKNIDKELIDWAVSKITTEYMEDVELLIGQVGGCKIETDEQNMSFDFFIPATEKGYQLSRTFIIEDMGYDLYPIAWERLEGIAMLNEPRMIFAFDRGEIIYAKDEHAKLRYQNLKQQMRDRLQDTNVTFPKSLELINTAMEMYLTMVYDDSLMHVRKAAGGIAFFLINAMAYISGMYLRAGYMNLKSELMRIKHKPEGFEVLYEELFEAIKITEITDICYRMIKMTRDYFIKYVPQKVDTKKEYNYADLAEWYQESRYTFRRIEHYCRINKYEQAYMNGCYIQIEFDAIKEEFGLKELDLMSAYHKNNLAEFSDRSKELEKYILEVLKQNNVSLRIFDNLEAFLKEQG